MTDLDEDATRLAESLQEHYGAAARKAARGQNAVDPATPAAAAPEPAESLDCCGPSSGPGAVTFGAGIYAPDDLQGLPVEAVAGSIGCANPVALAQLEAGEVVLDLGSGGGIDVLLSARRVGSTGKAYGVDMTPDMLKLARTNAAKAGATNVEFLEGRIEAVPLPDSTVDVVVSNCVINLSTDKAAVHREAFRVLRPGGRLAVADVAADAEPAPEVQADSEAWAGCLAGAVTRSQYRADLARAGFTDIEIVDDHPVADGLWSVFVRATKPAT